MAEPARSRKGSVRKRANGRWQARFLDAEGKARSKTFTRKFDAERWLTDTLAAIAKGQWDDPRVPKPAGPGTYADLVGEWRRGMFGRYKPSTRHRYEGVLKKYLIPEFGDTLLPDLKRKDIQAWVDGLTRQGLAPATVVRMFTVLRTSLMWAVKVDMLAGSPTVGVGLPATDERDMCYLQTPEQVATLADALPERYRAMVYFAAYTGMRWGEIAGLKIGRLDLMRGRVHVVETLTDVDGELTWGTPKTKRSRRTIGLPQFLVEMMVAHIAEFVTDPTDQDALVFRSGRDNPLRAAGFNKPWKRAVTVLPPDLHGLRFHDLRHTCVALLIANGVHPLAISRRLGHANIGITMDRYGHLLPTVEEELVDGLDATYRQTQDDEAAGEEGAV